MVLLFEQFCEIVSNGISEDVCEYMIRVGN